MKRNHGCVLKRPSKGKPKIKNSIATPIPKERKLLHLVPSLNNILIANCNNKLNTFS